VYLYLDRFRRFCRRTWARLYLRAPSPRGV